MSGASPRRTSATGPAAETPAFWCDANIHATEVSASSACLYLLNRLATQYGLDEQITRALDTRAFYVVPRVNPDGAELFFNDKPKVYPFQRPALSV